MPQQRGTMPHENRPRPRRRLFRHEDDRSTTEHEDEDEDDFRGRISLCAKCSSPYSASSVPLA
jgi:hypothetical protein